MKIKDPESERLAAEIAALTGESKTRAVQVSLRERWERLPMIYPSEDRHRDLLRFLEEEIWPSIPSDVRGKKQSRSEKERTLGYGREGV